MEILRKRYEKFIAINDHCEASLLLVRNFGTKEEIEICERIKASRDKNQGLSCEETQERYLASNHYHKLLYK